ncbi:cell death abnormality protein 1-like [Dreissena polymorpha]|uniref:cell death abnormality protein 1-like n=1 Tax=Dreissena polymorpha TaxID=45954 RepID=UPI0022653240|nr:cell death abnormality protein 1-like [Dreissena polymorpha]
MAKKCWQRFEIVFESLKIATLRKLNLYERLSERMKYPYSNKTLHSSAAFQKGLYLHEIGHAIGLVHEHQLPNRDQYIEILYQNVQPSMRIWFNKYSAQEVDQLKVDYEYSSVMHYGITAFSSDGKSQTIKALHPDKESSIGRVYRKELSFTDVKIVNLMYQCAKQCDSSIVCNNGGYVDQNCKCICPDGSDSCSKAKQDDKDGECFNAHESWQCAVWANQGECQRNPRFMLESCKKACRLCGNEKPDNGPHIALWTWQWLCRFANICPQNWTVATCKDNYESSKCDVWKEHGECIVNSEWMHKHCKKTCNACANSGPDPDVNCSNKHPKAEECEKWAAEGECQINRVWMPENCRKSCHMCGKSVVVITTTPEPDYNGECENIHNTLECDKWARTDECSLNPDWMIPNCRKSCKKCEGNDGGGGAQECKNTWDDVQCTGWARDQECMKNSVWMHRNCHKACTKCTPDGSTTDRQNEQTTTQPRITTPGACKNDHRSDKECDTWAKYGHCDLNEWMKVHCAAACGSCKSQEKTTTTSKPDKTDNGGNTGGCADQEKHCAAWARHGFCEDNPNTALRICKKSCNACTVETNECKDKHQLCGVWAGGGQCQRNSGYMLRSCQKSCTVC